MTRRSLFNRVASLGLFGGVTTNLLRASASPVSSTTLDLQRNGERFQIDISTPEGYRTAAWMLRDIKANNRTGFPDIEMLYLAAWAQAVLAEHHRYTVFEVASGLRTQATNSVTEQAARNSRHLPDSSGRFYAMDIRPIGSHIDDLGRILKYPAFGGVGLYSTHVHFDIRDRAVSW